MRIIMKTATVFLACATLTAAGTADGKRPITPEDYYALEVASDPQISPDGKVVAYVVTSIDRNSIANEARSGLCRSMARASPGRSPARRGNRRAKFYRLTAKGRRQLAVETGKWDKLAGAIARILRPAE
jgi:dipeptidyl aminopeptidase/acylaminoacyl peptidase